MPDAGEDPLIREVAGMGASTGKAAWRADAGLEDFENLIKERADKLLRETKPMRMVWMGFAVATFVVALVIIFMGLQGENLTLTYVGGVMNLLLGLPVLQLRKIQSDIARIIALPVRVKAQVKGCWLRSRSREKYEDCLGVVMDDIDQLFRIWSEVKRSKGKATKPGSAGAG
ncbi:MAG: hypothetical protein V3V98_08375 [Thermoplasmata archaeon]